jgi:hypothetical protein
MLVYQRVIILWVRYPTKYHHEIPTISHSYIMYILRFWGTTWGFNRQHIAISPRKQEGFAPETGWGRRG